MDQSVQQIMEKVKESFKDGEVYFFGNTTIGYKAWAGDIVAEGKTVLEAAERLLAKVNEKLA